MRRESSMMRPPSAMRKMKRRLGTIPVVESTYHWGRGQMLAVKARCSSAVPVEPVDEPRSADEPQPTGMCPVCATDVDVWHPGPGGRPHASCGHCWSLERHRFLASLLHSLRPYVETMGAVLEFAPQRQIQCLLKELAPSANYVGTDLFDLRFASVAADGCALPFDDASFDLILSFHVLEHIPDDFSAMCELRRVLKSGGILLVQVPRREGVPTEEDVDATPEERAKRFGQSDHVRYYGDDLEERFEAAGLRTSYFRADSFLSAADLVRFNVPANNPLWICRRRDSAEHSAGRERA